jgi:hypothetical protein
MKRRAKVSSASWTGFAVWTLRTELSGAMWVDLSDSAAKDLQGMRRRSGWLEARESKRAPIALSRHANLPYKIARLPGGGRARAPTDCK